MASASTIKYKVVTVRFDKVSGYAETPSRKALGDSINSSGTLVPIIVSPDPDNEGCYIIVNGRQRIQSMIEHGYDSCQALSAPMDRSTRAMINLASNGSGQPNPMVEADDIQVLINEGMGQRDICRALDLSPGYVSQRLKLATHLIPPLKQLVRVGDMPFSAARVVVQEPVLPDEIQTAITGMEKITLKAIKDLRKAYEASLVDSQLEELDIDLDSLPDFGNVKPIISPDEFTRLFSGEEIVVTFDGAEYTVTATPRES